MAKELRGAGSPLVTPAGLRVSETRGWFPGCQRILRQAGATGLGLPPRRLPHPRQLPCRGPGDQPGRRPVLSHGQDRCHDGIRGRLKHGDTAHRRAERGTCRHGQLRCHARIEPGRCHAFSSGTPSPRLLKLRLDEEPPRASPPSDPSLAHYGRAVLPSGPLIPRPAVRDSACGGEPTPGPVEQLPGGVGPGRTFTYQFASQLCWGDL